MIAVNAFVPSLLFFPLKLPIAEFWFFWVCFGAQISGDMRGCLCGWVFSFVVG
jgi:hypothetical protein